MPHGHGQDTSSSKDHSAGTNPEPPAKNGDAGLEVKLCFCLFLRLSTYVLTEPSLLFQKCDETTRLIGKPTVNCVVRNNRPIP